MADRDEEEVVEKVDHNKSEVDDEGEDIFNMSDDQLNDYFTKAANNTDSAEETTDAKQEEVQEEGEDEETDSEVLEDDEDEEDSEDEESDDSEEEDSDESDDGDSEDDSADDGDTEDEDEDSGTDESKSEDEDKSDESTTIDYKAEVKKALTPFKANGRMIQVDSVDDLVTLAKMGANYNKKMAALKPSLKVVKMLEQNDLLDEQKIAHLIDISKKDPNAIGKLLKDADIDPMDLDQESDSVTGYKPKDYTVNDAQLALDDALASIRDNESYPITIDTIGNKWDAKSREMILNDPTVIPVIDEHVQSGIFEKIVTVMEKEKLLGRLNGMPDLVAYKQIGDRLDAEGAFAPPQPETKPKAKPTTSNAVRKQKRKAAASNRTVRKKKAPADFDPLSMSDDEFEKLSSEDLYR